MNLTERIESVILSNLQPPKKRKIGIESESLFYNDALQRIPVNPTNSFSATDFLNDLESLQSNDKIKSGYSLEPGGQLEWASPPMRSLSEINEIYLQHKVRIQSVIDRENLKIINYSTEPLFHPLDIDLIKNKKYQLMDKMFRKTGKFGQWMMRNTASVQINLDFSSREEAESMAFIADCLTPIASILFANSPFWRGKSGGNDNLRYKIWNDTDNSRCGDLADHGMLSSEGLIHEYAKYIQRVPAIFITDDRGSIIEFNGTLGDWLSQLEKEKLPTAKHIQIALHQIFTHVRFKNVLEIRGSDKPPKGYEFAPAAFWIGLLLDEGTHQQIYKIVSVWTLRDRKKLNYCAQNLDLNQMGPQNKSISEWINLVCNLSLGGLKTRSIDHDIEDESGFLQPYVDLFKLNGICALNIQKTQQKNQNTIQKFIEKEKLNRF